MTNKRKIIPTVYTDEDYLRLKTGQERVRRQYKWKPTGLNRQQMKAYDDAVLRSDLIRYEIK